MHADLKMFLEDVWKELTKAHNVFKEIDDINNLEKVKHLEEMRKVLVPEAVGDSVVMFHRPLKPQDRPRPVLYDSPDRKELRNIPAKINPHPGTAGRIQKIIYDLYNKDSQTPLDAAVAPGWLKEISAIGRGRTIRRVQGGTAEGKEILEFDDLYTRYCTADNKSDATYAPLTKGFILFNNPAYFALDSSLAKFRVYINVNSANPRRGPDLLGRLVHELTRTDALPVEDEPDDTEVFVVGAAPSSASPVREALRARQREENEQHRLLKAARNYHSLKIVGPLSQGTRSDGIVVYCLTREGSLAVIKLLETFPRYLFSPQTPRMTQKVDSRALEGVGISTGEEPPQLGIGIRDTNEMSFGSLRADLITAAVLEAEFSERLTPALKDFEFFCSRVYVAFKGHGLDPDVPWANGVMAPGRARSTAISSRPS